MLSSTRQVCARRLAPSFPPALPAESSRQAILRAAARPTPAGARCVQSDSSRRTPRDVPPHKTARGISSGSTSHAALALAEDNRQYPTQHYRNTCESRSSQDHIPPPDTTADEYQLDPSTSQAQSQWLDSWLYTYDLSSLPPSPLPPLETFRGLIFSQPLLALLTLTKLSQDDFRQIKHKELRNLMHGASKVLRERPVLLSRLNEADVTKALRILRAILFSLPTGEKGYKDAYKGNYFQGQILSHFLNLCSKMKQPRLFKSVFQERLREQLSRQPSADRPILQFDVIASNLSAQFEWELLLDLFNPSAFPNQYYTPEILACYMQAHFGTYQSAKIPRIFELYHVFNLKPIAKAYNHLVQSYLEMGDLPAAREVVREANSDGIGDYSSQQIAILRGYRALGHDVDLEKRVLYDINRLGIPLSAKLLNALIRLRMEAGDHAAAKQLLEKFDLSDWTQSTDQEAPHLVSPNIATAALVFELFSTTGDLQEIGTLWRDMKAGKAGITDQLVETLLRALIRLDLMDEAISIVQPGSESQWALPDGVRPGVLSLNYLINQLGRQRGLQGVEFGLSLLHQTGVPPDDLTLKTVVDFIRTSVQHKPAELAYLVDRVTKSSHLKPTQSLLDSILQSAINAIARSESRELEPSTSGHTFSPTAGMNLSPRFEKSLERILESLKAIDSKSGSRSLVNRLKYDAMTSTRIQNMPSARIVWNSLIERGYKPNEKHFNALIQGYSAAGLMYQAQDLLLLANQIGYEPTKSMYFSILVGWGKIQRPSNSRKAYEKIKSSFPASLANHHNRNQDLEILTAMIQAYNHSKMYHEAAFLCYTDLKDLNVTLDRKAINVTAQALRGSGDLKGCLELLEKYGPALDPVSRRIVKGIKNYQRKALGLAIRQTQSRSHPQSELTKALKETERLVDLIEDPRRHNQRLSEQVENDQAVLKLAETLLEKDDQARPAETRRWIRLNRGVRRRFRRAIIGPKLDASLPEQVLLKKIQYDEKVVSPHLKGKRRARCIRAIKRRSSGYLEGVGTIEEKAEGMGRRRLRRGRIRRME
ncbi:uncharacterized protein I303_105024 [Kwoniella dejecticola CBS 10117]|uniref:Pentatricopeptide repeat domain-containing protein n=1 Tax=Kwoniella dejecticola CBS 10117 TaxID=1296121 RepID=A0A1A6A3N8_9TREE|nr:uncharacterized protein I303_05530 [Kwoniella dejecticola CBS 10117]OBR84671.1 hypothetical protein I303_05530 [Kwoniella dejecticola CBS 10117]